MNSFSVWFDSGKGEAQEGVRVPLVQLHKSGISDVEEASRIAGSLKRDGSAADAWVEAD